MFFSSWSKSILSPWLLQLKDFLKRREKKTPGTKNHLVKLANLFNNHEEDKENDVHALDFKILNSNY